MTFIHKGKEMEIGETRIRKCPSLHPQLEIRITRTSEKTFSYEIVKVVKASTEFNSFQDAKEHAEKELSKIT